MRGTFPDFSYPAVQRPDSRLRDPDPVRACRATAAIGPLLRNLLPAPAKVP